MAKAMDMKKTSSASVAAIFVLAEIHLTLWAVWLLNIRRNSNMP